jgi:hypothetical protein
MDTIINLQSGREGTWFNFFYSDLDLSTGDITYGDPIENGPRAKIRNPTPFFQEREKLRETESSMVFNKKARKMEKVISNKELTKEERQKENDDATAYMIQELEGFKLEGKVLNNTREDKLAAMEIPIFAMFVNRCVELVQKQAAVEEKIEEKNSLTGSSGKTTTPDSV